VTILFNCNECKTTDISLTIESGPEEPYVQRWGKYNTYEALLDHFEEQFKYSDLETFFEKFKASTEYRILTHNCKDFAYELYTTLYNYNPDRLKYKLEFLVYVPNGQSATSLQMTMLFAKHLFLLPYRHFVYYTWYNGKEREEVKIQESDAARVYFEKQKEAGAKSIKLECKLIFMSEICYFTREVFELTVAFQNSVDINR
jgi:hypothetical protein